MRGNLYLIVAFGLTSVEIPQVIHDRCVEGRSAIAVEQDGIVSLSRGIVRNYGIVR